MSLLARYIMRATLANTALVTLVLLVLSSLQIFLDQQDDVGKGTFGFDDALMYMGLMLPKYAFDLLPIAGLIGALLALGNLARSMELIVVRTSGISALRIGAWVGGAGVVLMAIMWTLGEYVAPPMERYARQMKTAEIFRDYGMAGSRSVWAKDGSTIISVQQNAANQYGGIYVFKFDPQRRLDSVGHANSAQIDEAGHWLLQNFRQSRFEGERVIADRSAEASLDTNLSPEFLGLATVEPQTLPGRGLFQYVQHLKANGLDARVYETAFWTRISRTVAVAVIVVLAVPFAFGPMRSTGTGARTVVGILIGVAFFLIARMLESGGAVFNVPPLIVAWAPTAVLAVITFVAVSRVR
jgi:lipopolysaccharide export system permease protein